MIEAVFSTEHLPEEDRFDFWRELMAHTHVPLELSSEFSADFHAEQRIIGLGDVQVWPATFQPLVFRRTPKLIRQSDPEVYSLSLLLRGKGGAASWGGQQAVLDPFDFHTSDSSRPCEIRACGDRITMVGVEVPKALLPVPRDKADQVIGRPMSGRAGVGALFAQFLIQLAHDTDSYGSSDRSRLETVAVDLLSVLFSNAVDAVDALPSETQQRALVLRIKAFVHQHLGDPELTPGVVAAAHHISLRSLHRLFQGQGTTVAGFIRHQRLKRARGDLADPAFKDRPIHAVAARWGFPRAAEFTRAFRNAYGTSPREYRNAVQRGAVAAAGPGMPRGAVAATSGRG